MKKSFIVLAVLGLIVVIGGMSCVGRYNSLVTANEEVDGAWAQVENVLQRRADLIPNLVNTVKGYAEQEREIFTAVAEARSKLIGAKGPEQAAEANNQMNSALSRLLAISERYPDLKSNQNFMRLQDELAGTENRIAVERKRYNEVVKSFNQRVKQFPNNLFAGMMNFDTRTYFEADATAQQVPNVEF